MKDQEEKHTIFVQNYLDYINNTVGMEDDFFVAHFKIAEARGHFIHRVVMFEDLLELLIAIYYIGNNFEKIEEFRFTILPKDSPLSFKISLLFYIMKNKYPVFYNSINNEFRDQFLVNIATIRNKYAHYFFSNGNEKNNGKEFMLHHMATKGNKKHLNTLEINESVLVSHLNNVTLSVEVVLNISNRLINGLGDSEFVIPERLKKLMPNLTQKPNRASGNSKERHKSTEK